MERNVVGDGLDSILRVVLGRVPVSWSNRRAIRHVISRMKGGMRAWRDLPRDDRRLVMMASISIHEENRAMYELVMRGLF